MADAEYEPSPWDWDRTVAVSPSYPDDQARTTRRIPVFLATRRG